MHTKIKGNVGELAVAKDLASKGYAVFTELGDSSNVDLIVLTEDDTIKIQVKTQWESKDGTACLGIISSGPGYKYRYDLDTIDMFALYVADRDTVLYIPSVQLKNRRRGLRVRFEPTKNGQTKGINLAEDYAW